MWIPEHCRCDKISIKNSETYRHQTYSGIAVFAVTNTMLAFVLLETKGIHEDVIIVGMLWFVGGLGSWVTAILEYMVSL
jgi:succinate-acetate transporter protein